VTSPADRVAVPTNGHRPALTDDALDAPSVDASGAPSEPTAAPGPTLTSGQVIAGLGVLAALILLFAGRRRPPG
jgi:hypothetical protein